MQNTLRKPAQPTRQSRQRHVVARLCPQLLGGVVVGDGAHPLRHVLIVLLHGLVQGALQCLKIGLRAVGHAQERTVALHDQVSLQGNLAGTHRGGHGLGASQHKSDQQCGGRMLVDDGCKGRRTTQVVDPLQNLAYVPVKSSLSKHSSVGVVRFKSSVIKRIQKLVVGHFYLLIGGDGRGGVWLFLKSSWSLADAIKLSSFPFMGGSFVVVGLLGGTANPTPAGAARLLGAGA